VASEAEQGRQVVHAAEGAGAFGGEPGTVALRRVAETGHAGGAGGADTGGAVFHDDAGGGRGIQRGAGVEVEVRRRLRPRDVVAGEDAAVESAMKSGMLAEGDLHLAVGAVGADGIGDGGGVERIEYLGDSGDQRRALRKFR